MNHAGVTYYKEVCFVTVCVCVEGPNLPPLSSMRPNHVTNPAGQISSDETHSGRQLIRASVRLPLAPLLIGRRSYGRCRLVRDGVRDDPTSRLLCCSTLCF